MRRRNLQLWSRDALVFWAHGRVLAAFLFGAGGMFSLLRRDPIAFVLTALAVSALLVAGWWGARRAQQRAGLAIPS